jgi:enamine deaminase RidA (YjgF/YER057c/UK114 family)
VLGEGYVFWDTCLRVSNKKWRKIMNGNKAFEIRDYKEITKLTPFGAYSAMTVIKPGATLYFLSGLIARDEETGEVVDRTDLGAQAARIFERIKKVLATEGLSMQDVYYCHYYITDGYSLEDVNKHLTPVVNRYFEGRVPPCDVWCKVPGITEEGALLEIEAWAAAVKP